MVSWFRRFVAFLGRRQQRSVVAQARPVMMDNLEGRRMLSASGPWSTLANYGGLVNISIGDSQVLEGNNGTTYYATFTIGLNGLSTVPVAVHWSTVDGTAHAGVDYQAVTDGGVRFPVGQTSAVISVPIIGNTVQEGNRTFKVVLNTPVGAPINRKEGICTIYDDDLPQVSIVARDANASENANKAGILRISRTGATDKSLKVNYTVSGTGKKGVDYVALPGSATIGIGKAYVDVLVRPVVDSAVKSTNVVVKLSSNTTYFLTNKTSATVNITDSERVVPAAYLVTAPAITAPSGSAYQFTVRYTDNKAMDAATVGTGCLRVTGPNGFNSLAEFVSKTVSTNGRAVVAVYRVLAPGGSWDNSDNGSYVVNVVANKVRDKAGNALTAGGLGTIQVTIP